MKFLTRLLNTFRKAEREAEKEQQKIVMIPRGYVRAVLKRAGVPHVSRKKHIKKQWAFVDGVLTCLN